MSRKHLALSRTACFVWILRSMRTRKSFLSRKKPNMCHAKTQYLITTPILGFCVTVVTQKPSIEQAINFYPYIPNGYDPLPPSHQIPTSFWMKFWTNSLRNRLHSLRKCENCYLVFDTGTSENLRSQFWSSHEKPKPQTDKTKTKKTIFSSFRFFLVFWFVNRKKKWKKKEKMKYEISGFSVSVFFLTLIQLLFPRHTFLSNRTRT